MKKPPFTKPAFAARWTKWTAGWRSLRNRSGDAPQAVRNTSATAVLKKFRVVTVMESLRKFKSRRRGTVAPQAVRRSRSSARSSTVTRSHHRRPVTVMKSAMETVRNARRKFKLPQPLRALRTVRKLHRLPFAHLIPPRIAFRAFRIFQTVRRRVLTVWQTVRALPLRLMLLVSLILMPSTLSAVNTVQRASWGIHPQTIATAITPAIADYQFPPHITLPNFPIAGALRVQYTIDESLQAETKRLLKKHKPDYGIFVALDADTGRVLAMASRARAPVAGENLSLRNNYPAASISKIITVVAAINEKKLSADTVIPFNGKATTLYKKSVFKHRDHKWTRRYSLKKSFARSVNSVFGRIGALEVGGDVMLDYAHRLGFNQTFASDFNFGNGTVTADPTDDWQVAEMASGFTLRNKLSPLHGAVLAAMAVNGGAVIPPALVKAIIGPNGVPLYWHERPETSAVMDDRTARELKKMMRATVESGTARGSFLRLGSGALKDVVIGGKTGALTGLSPRGRYDWFVGFAERGDRKIAFATLCINKKRWYVKSTQLARELLEFYFRDTAS